MRAFDDQRRLFKRLFLIILLFVFFISPLFPSRIFRFQICGSFSQKHLDTRNCIYFNNFRSSMAGIIIEYQFFPFDWNKAYECSVNPAQFPRKILIAAIACSAPSLDKSPIIEEIYSANCSFSQLGGMPSIISTCGMGRFKSRKPVGSESGSWTCYGHIRWKANCWSEWKSSTIWEKGLHFHKSFQEITFFFCIFCGI